MMMETMLKGWSLSTNDNGDCMLKGWSLSTNDDGDYAEGVEPVY